MCYNAQTRLTQCVYSAQAHHTCRTPSSVTHRHNNQTHVGIRCRSNRIRHRHRPIRYRLVCIFGPRAVDSNVEPMAAPTMVETKADTWCHTTQFALPLWFCRRRRPALTHSAQKRALDTFPLALGTRSGSIMCSSVFGSHTQIK